MDISIVSKYRQELMGLAIIQVVLLHVFTLGDYPVPGIIRKFISLFFVQGFMLLSGVSMYYSYVKDPSLKNFYIKRVKSLYIPYLLIAFPSYLIIYSFGCENMIPLYSEGGFYITSPFLSFIGKITTLSYWVEGNFNGMWYIASTVVLYLVFPFVYKFIFGSTNIPLLSVIETKMEGGVKLNLNGLLLLL